LSGFRVPRWMRRIKPQVQSAAREAGAVSRGGPVRSGAALILTATRPER
jgi:hypothetical protein